MRVGENVLSVLLDHLVTALFPADIGALPRSIKFRNALPDEGSKFRVAHVAELVYMGGFDLLDVEAHELAAFRFRADGGAQLPGALGYIADPQQLA